jgi:PadR family transcriptional regulator AphA
MVVNLPAKPTLTPTSFMVLGLMRAIGEPCTPYDLKRAHAMSVGYFWTLPHSQLYAEPPRLAKAGHVTEQREEGGRRRRLFSLTTEGEAALDAWLAEPTDKLAELRDMALLQVFYGADMSAVAERQLAAHEERLGRYEALHADLAMATEAPRGPITTLEAGIAYERTMIRYWRSLV